MTHPLHPGKQGLYGPAYEHDACGVGFVVDLKGRPSHDLVRKGIQVLLNLEHRGACGCEKNTGDGAGVLIQMPDRFLRQEAHRLGLRLPEYGSYATGIVFLPTNADERRRCEGLVETIIREEGQYMLGWRQVPTDNATLGYTARATEPVMRQVFVGRAGTVRDDAAFERKLYIIRKRVENAVRASDLCQRGMFYVPSLS